MVLCRAARTKTMQRIQNRHGHIGHGKGPGTTIERAQGPDPRQGPGPEQAPGLIQIRALGQERDRNHSDTFSASIRHIGGQFASVSSNIGVSILFQSVQLSQCAIPVASEPAHRNLRPGTSAPKRPRRNVDAETATPKHQHRNVDAETSAPKCSRRGIFWLEFSRHSE